MTMTQETAEQRAARMARREQAARENLARKATLQLAAEAEDRDAPYGPFDTEEIWARWNSPKKPQRGPGI